MRGRLLALALLLGASCGGRTQLDGGREGVAGAPPVTACNAVEDCGVADACRAVACSAGVCVYTQTLCDDGDPCTANECAAATGCSFPALTRDADGDGYAAPRPGTAPGAPEACGADCNDELTTVFPGARELCDAIDNDCDGSVDEGAAHLASAEPGILVSSRDDERAVPGALAATSSEFVFTYSAMRSPNGLLQNVLRGVRADGRLTFETLITDVNADSFAGPLLFAAGKLVTAWEDARQNDYDIYFAAFAAHGARLTPTARITDAPFKSLHPALAWNGSEYLVVWDDRRAEQQASGGGDLAQIHAQRLDANGAPLGRNVRLSTNEPVAEYPDIAVGAGRVGLVFTSLSNQSSLVFRVFDSALQRVGSSSAPIGADVRSPKLHWAEDRFIALWTTTNADLSPGDAVWGATFDANGTLLLPPRKLTSDRRFVRSHAALQLAEGLLLVWADYGNAGRFELQHQLFNRDLVPINMPQRLTTHAGDTMSPSLALGPRGSIGVLYEVAGAGTRQVFLKTLTCAIAP